MCHTNLELSRSLLYRMGCARGTSVIQQPTKLPQTFKRLLSLTHCPHHERSMVGMNKSLSRPILKLGRVL